MKNEFPIVDRPEDTEDFDACVIVELETGERHRFFVLDLTDEDYIERARVIKQIEDRRNAQIF